VQNRKCICLRKAALPYTTTYRQRTDNALFTSVATIAAPILSYPQNLNASRFRQALFPKKKKGFRQGYPSSRMTCLTPVASPARVPRRRRLRHRARHHPWPDLHCRQTPVRHATARPPRVDMSRAMWWRRLQRALPAGGPAPSQPIGPSAQGEPVHGQTATAARHGACLPRLPRPCLLPGQRFGTPTRVPAHAFARSVGFIQISSELRACERRRSFSQRHHPSARAKRTRYSRDLLISLRFFVAFGASTSPARTFSLCWVLIFLRERYDFSKKRELGGLCQHVTLHSELNFRAREETRWSGVSARHVLYC